MDAPEVRTVPIIGLSGKKCSGKGVVARRLTERYGATVYSFADPLKVELKNLIWRVTGIEIDPWKNKDAWTRRALQLLGTDIVRGFDDDAWVKYALQQIDPLIKQGTLVVFDDVRFPNEADAIRSYGGVVLRLNRESAAERRADVERLYGPQDPAAYEHSSETALDDYDGFHAQLSAPSVDRLLLGADLVTSMFLNHRGLVSLDAQTEVP